MSDNAIPPDMEKYFRAGQPIYRGDSKNVPSSLHTSGQIISHLFPQDEAITGKSWSTHPAVAKMFARKERTLSNIDETRVEYILHSNIDPSNVSFDRGYIDDDEGNRRNWSFVDWRERHSGGRGHGDLGEEEVIMKAHSQIPITGITMRYGSGMNHVQFGEPIPVRTSFPTRLY